MICNIVINQQASLPVSDKVIPEAKMKDSERKQKRLKNHTKT